MRRSSTLRCRDSMPVRIGANHTFSSDCVLITGTVRGTALRVRTGRDLSLRAKRPGDRLLAEGLGTPPDGLAS